MYPSFAACPTNRAAGTGRPGQAEHFAIWQETFIAAARQSCYFIDIHKLCDFHNMISPRVHRICFYYTAGLGA